MNKLGPLADIEADDIDRSIFEYNNPDFERQFCKSFRQFVEDPYYLGIGEDTWEKIKQEGDRVWNLLMTGKITEAIFLWGIGSGKSYLSSAMSLLFVHYLLCLKDPHKFFKIINDKPLAVVNMGTTATQAKNVIFASIRKFIENSQFFQEYYPQILQTEIRFPTKNITLYCGNSQETMPIGMNVICGVLDEAAWYLDNENKSIAENIYNVLKNRITSRFGDKGFVMVVSAVRYVDDFIMRHYEKNIDVPYIYTAPQYKTWEIKDSDKMSTETFDFVVSVNKEGKPLEMWKNIPIDFKKTSESNPEKFMRDFGVKPSLVLEPFDKEANVIEDIVVNRESPTDNFGNLREEFVCKDDAPRYIHIDLGLRKDACGIAMGHQEGEVNVNEEVLPMIYIDFVLQIKPRPNEEIKFNEIRNLVYTFVDRKFKVKKVTLDSWQSIDTIQQLQERGIDADVQSVDKDMKAYETMKEAIHTKRFNCYRYRPLLNEYKRLELVKGKKVDHPPGGSKDVSDAIAGVCRLVAENYSSGPIMTIV